MHDTPLFQWHPDARLLVGDREVSRPHGRGTPTGLATIPPVPASAATTALGQALQAGAPFLVGQAPPGITCPLGSFLTQTGGTTGAPSILRRSQKSWIASFDLHARRFGHSPSDRLAVLGQLGHSLALFGLIEALHLGLEAHLLADMSPGRQADHIRDRNVSILYATPTQLRLLIAGGARLPGLRLVLVGGGPLPPPLFTRIRAACPHAEIRHFYGAAETSFISMTDDETPPGSVGRAYPGVEIRICDSSLIWVRSPYLCEGYVDRRKMLRRDGDGFVTVGEIGYLDAAGFLFLQGRADRMVTVADQNVFPDQIETALAALPEMPTCAVQAHEDEKRGTALTLYVEGRDDPDRRKAIETLCRKALPARSLPRRIVFLVEFPLTPAGKPDLKKLETLR